MRANLTPTQVTDINGRTTIVHKRLDQPQSGQKALKVPAPSLGANNPASAVSRTPLKAPEPLTERENEAFMAWQEVGSRQLKLRREITATFTKPMDEEAASLAWRIVNSGNVSQDVVLRLLSRYHQRRTPMVAKAFKSNPEEELGLLRSSLRLVEKLGQDYPDIQSESEATRKSYLERIVRGYGYSPKIDNRRAYVPVETEEELASQAAVAAYLLDSATNGRSQHTDTTYACADGTKINGTYISNRSMDTFLRENPNEVRGVLSYVRERGLGNTVKDTKAVKEYLKDVDGNNAVNEGWL